MTLALSWFLTCDFVQKLIKQRNEFISFFILISPVYLVLLIQHDKYFSSFMLAKCIGSIFSFTYVMLRGILM